MRAVGNGIISTLIVFNLVFSYSGFAIPRCDCCNGDHESSKEVINECCSLESENFTQSSCHTENREEKEKQKHCNCTSDCECSFICNMPDHNNAVNTTIQQFPNKLLNQIIQQPVNLIVEHFTSLLIRFKPDKAKLNPLKLPLTIPLRI